MTIFSWQPVSVQGCWGGRRIFRKNSTKRPPETSTPIAHAPTRSHVNMPLSSLGRTSRGTFVATLPRGPETSSMNVHCPSRPTGMRTSKWLNPGSTVWGRKGPTDAPAGPSPRRVRPEEIGARCASPPPLVEATAWTRTVKTRRPAFGSGGHTVTAISYPPCCSR